MKKTTPSEAARILGASGASKGGKATAEKLTPKQRSRNARKAARARWAKARHVVAIYRGTIPAPGEPISEAVLVKKLRVYVQNRKEGGPKS